MILIIDKDMLSLNGRLEEEDYVLCYGFEEKDAKIP